MANFVRTDDYLKVTDINGQEHTVKFVKTKRTLDKLYNNIILFNDTYDKSYPIRSNTISYNVEYLSKNRIVPTILYCSKNYIKNNSSVIIDYINQYGKNITEIYLSNEILNYDFAYDGNNLTYFEDIDGFELVDVGSEDSSENGLLGILLSFYLNYTRICYVFPINIDKNSVVVMKEFKKIHNITHKINIHNCSEINNPFVHKTPINTILKPILLIQQFFIHKDKHRQDELVL